MEITNLVHLVVQDQSHISEARRLSASALNTFPVPEQVKSDILIIVSELVSNLIKHAKPTGTFFLQSIGNSSSFVIIAIAIDTGRGIININESLRDGFSTAGTAGTGLGSVKRLSDSFDIHTLPGIGTAVVATKIITSPILDYDLGVINLPKKGEYISGDSWAIKYFNNKIRIIVADGLGHGPLAADASKAIINSFLRSKEEYSIDTLLNNIHLEVKRTRGAAAAISEILPSDNILNYCGIGNINSVSFFNHESKSLLSHNGIVGHDIRKIVRVTHPWNVNSTLIMHSDGLSSRWSLSSYPGLLTKPSPLIASVLYRDFSRGNDDSTIVVFKQKSLK
jgi:anti-sigma regulatory factor (Ser/Thr protein kinase)